MNYDVTYEKEGRREIESVTDCHNPGEAFAAVLQRYPGARLIAAETESTVPFLRDLHQVFRPPPVQREPRPEPKRAGKPRRDDPDGLLPL